MANKIEVKMNSAGAIEVMNSGGVQSFLLSKAQAIAGTASGSSGGQYTADVRAGQTRAHARVTTADKRARDMEYNYNCLLKAMGSGR